VRGIEVSALGTYPQCSDYRRGFVLIDTGINHYAVDFFHVAGGKQHDYMLHGPPGQASLSDTDWSEPAPGTLAGENVKLGEMYDDPQMAAEGDKKGYYEYRGSGFQHLTKVQKRLSGDAIVDYVHAKDSKAALRIRVLASPGQTLMAADARISPVNHPQLIKYLIARGRQTGSETLDDQFISVLEPHSPGEALIRKVTRLDPTSGGTALLIEHADGRRDVVIHDPAGAPKTVSVDDGKILTDARLAVVRLDPDKQVAGVFFAGGKSLVAGGRTFTATPAITGPVISIDAKGSTARIRTPLGDEALAGRVVTFGNAIARSAHQIKAAHRDGDDLVVEFRDDVLAGLLRVSGVADHRLNTRTRLPFAASYVGATVMDTDFKPRGRVAAADQDHLDLADAPIGEPLEGRDVWVTSIGPGDVLTVPAVFTWQR
jgi:hypothetical protein